MNTHLEDASELVGDDGTREEVLREAIELRSADIRWALEDKVYVPPRELGDWLKGYAEDIVRFAGELDELLRVAP